MIIRGAFLCTESDYMGHIVPVDVSWLMAGRRRVGEDIGSLSCHVYRNRITMK